MAQIKTPYLGNVAQVAGQSDFTFGGERDLAGHESFNAGLANGDTVIYRAKHSALPQWEIGLGTWTSATKTLARTTVYRSSAGGTTKATFSGGTVEVESLDIGVGSTTWTLSNIGATRTFDGTQGTAATISAALALLISDLQAQGVLK